MFPLSAKWAVNYIAADTEIFQWKIQKPLKGVCVCIGGGGGGGGGMGVEVIAYWTIH